MNWISLNDISQLEQIIQQSGSSSVKAVLIFKHSTRCSISAMALSRLERSWKDDDALPAYYLDLLNHRNISSEIAARFAVEHESPQALLIKDGKCIYHASHSDISTIDILSALPKN